MSYQIVPSDKSIFDAQEILLSSAGTDKPTDVPVGSVAYTADLAYMAMFDGTTWHQIGG